LGVKSQYQLWNDEMPLKDAKKEHLKRKIALFEELVRGHFADRKKSKFFFDHPKFHQVTLS